MTAVEVQPRANHFLG